MMQERLVLTVDRDLSLCHFHQALTWAMALREQLYGLNPEVAAVFTERTDVLRFFHLSNEELNPACSACKLLAWERGAD